MLTASTKQAQKKVWGVISIMLITLLASTACTVSEPTTTVAPGYSDYYEAGTVESER